jgi:16S rRNA (guanine527-N7)-methyltransferase
MHKILTDGFSALGLELTEEMSRRFAAYGQHLGERNEVMNLTAISGDEDIARLHFLDCAALLSLYDFSGASVIDIGSGAGFPGLPLKIAKSDISLTMLDSQKKRVDFLEETCQKLGLYDVRCVWARAEEAAMDMGGSFDIAVSRAVAKLNILCELCLPFVSTGGVFIAMKGPDCEEELKEAGHAISVLGGGKTDIKIYHIPGTEISHSAVIIRKTKPTPPQYPRQFGRIKKAPL